jgi:hypothetical protein
MNPATIPLAAKLLSELTRGGFLKGGGATIAGTTVSANSTVVSNIPKSEAVAMIRRGCPAFPSECAGLLEKALVPSADTSFWSIHLDFSDEETARAVGHSSKT